MIWAFISGIMFIASVGIGPKSGGMWVFSIFSALFSTLVRDQKSQEDLPHQAGEDSGPVAGQDYISVDEISSAIGKDHDETAEELRGMIQDNVFTGRAYMDRQECDLYDQP